jgi:hypothetical protein
MRRASPAVAARILLAMLLLVTGASGAGKSTVRRLVAPQLGAAVECVELGDVVEVPRAPTIAWRQRATETIVRRAVGLQSQGRGHARDRTHMPEVLTTGGWEEMRWERWMDARRLLGPWARHVIDTSGLAVEQVATEVLDWCRRALAGQTQLLRVNDHRA